MNKGLRAPRKPSVLGHVAIAGTEIAAIRLCDRVRRCGQQTLWIEHDGCIVAADHDSRAAKEAPETRIVGTYAQPVKASDVAEDIAETRKHFAESAMRARA